MAEANWEEIRKLIDECKASGGRKLDLVGLTMEYPDDPLLLDEVLHFVYQHLPDLERISMEISGEGTTVDVLAKHAKNLPTLKPIDLLVTGDLALHALARQAETLPPIRWLGLDAISDGGLMALANHAEKFSELQDLDFDGCSFGDEGLCAFAAQAKHFVSLERFFECDTQYLQVSDKGAADLKNLTGLKILGLEQWPVGDEWLTKFARQAKPFTNLRKLYLHLTQVGDDGVRALAKHAEKFTNLEVLWLAFTEISDDAVIALAHAWRKGHFQKLEELSLV